jgi:hypothetical protein
MYRSVRSEMFIDTCQQINPSSGEERYIWLT